MILMKEKKDTDTKNVVEKTLWWVKLFIFLEQLYIFLFFFFVTICLFDIIFFNALGIFEKDLESVKKVIVAYRTVDVKWIDIIFVYIVQGCVVMCFSLSILYNPLIIYIVKKIKKKYYND